VGTGTDGEPLPHAPSAPRRSRSVTTALHHRTGSGGRRPGLESLRRRLRRARDMDGARRRSIPLTPCIDRPAHRSPRSGGRANQGDATHLHGQRSRPARPTSPSATLPVSVSRARAIARTSGPLVYVPNGGPR
jgi:hypothetical protein